LVLGHRVNYRNCRTFGNLNGDSLTVLHDSGDSLPLQPKSLPYASQTTRSFFPVSHRLGCKCFKRNAKARLKHRTNR
jgi:hypothetical protein